MPKGSGSVPLRIPNHLGIVMDGNGRWAIARGLPRLAGHRAGTENIRPILRACVDYGIKVLTIYAFSTENWRRPEAEVSGLMTLLSEFIRQEVEELHSNGVQVRHSGHLLGLSKDRQAQIRDALELTKNNDRIVLNVAFNYGGRAEILDAIRRIIVDGVTSEEINEALVNQYLYTAGLHDPDLIVRTGGEMRISNFLIWQAAYAEYYSTPTNWPDFDEVELLRAIEAYSQRERRFGGVPEPAL